MLEPVLLISVGAYFTVRRFYGPKFPLWPGAVVAIVAFVLAVVARLVGFELGAADAAPWLRWYSLGMLGLIAASLSWVARIERQITK